ncbi:MFS transporter [Nocardioides bruguierae]|uniref:MFS transporter n=1 Tax=Nocardioides bruguierae TaxID=2945102 RepID=A0A9X2D861_9ACTN|nr:MFS transporter [Nocardioides bruguierae]MCM0621148.1 MFS transporter [Nocardioides bruguierae]
MSQLTQGVDRVTRRPSSTVRAELGILTTCALNNFMIFGTFSALSVAIPAVARELEGGVTTASWMLIGFLLTNASTTILFSRLSDEWGRRWFYFGGILTFTLASVLCFFVTEPVVLVLLRAVQGLASACSTSTSSAVISDVFPPSRLPMALGIFMAVAGLGTLLGPIVGGLLVDHFGWRSIFVMGAALGVGAVVVGWDALKNVHAPGLRRFRLDVPGTVTSIVGIAALILAVQMIGEDVPLVVPAASAAVAVVSLWAFATAERRSDHPLVDPAVVAGTRGRIYLAAFCGAVPQTGVVVLTTLYLQLLHGSSAAEAGLHLLPMGTAMLAGSLVAGVVQRWTTPAVANVVGAFGVATGSTAVVVVIATDAPLAWLTVALVVSGFFQGTYQATLAARLLIGVPADRRGIAQGLRATIMNGSNAIATATVVAAVTWVVGGGDLSTGSPGSLRVGLVVAASVLAGCGLAAAVLTARAERGSGVEAQAEQERTVSSAVGA